MYKTGDKFNIRVRLDDSTTFEQDLIISYAFSNIIITCGHCLPSNAIIPNGKILYTSGFDTPTENQEIGLIQLNPDINIKPQYKLTKTTYLNYLINSNQILNKQLYMINQSKSYDLNLIKIFDYESFNLLKFNQLNMVQLFDENQIPTNYYFIHSIDKILSKSNDLFNIFNISKVGIAISKAKAKPLDNSDLKLIKQIAQQNNWILESDIVYYVSEPSFSGSPIIIKGSNKDYFMGYHFMGYHLGSTLGFKVKSNQIIKIYKFIYFKFLSINMD
jgi:hypothetical protein